MMKLSGIGLPLSVIMPASTQTQAMIVGERIHHRIARALILSGRYDIVVERPKPMVLDIKMLPEEAKIYPQAPIISGGQDFIPARAGKHKPKRRIR